MMQLNYRGLSYQVTDASVETAETEVTGHFLGQSYTMRRPVHSSSVKSVTTLKFRGIAYTKSF